MTEIARTSHYVPQSYMRRWGVDASKNVWAYRTLVPRAGYRVWDLTSTRGIAVRRDLYTSVAGGAESDRIERWLNREVEIPGGPVLDKLCRGEKLTGRDRRALARYIVALEVRNPVGYSEHVTQVSALLQMELHEALEQSVRRIEDAVLAGRPVAVPEFVPGHSIDVRVGADPESDDDRVTVDVNVTVGRESWLDNIEYVVNDVSRLLEAHDWSVLRPNPGWVWFTSDHPVVRLLRAQDGSFNFQRWAGVGTEILFPLSAHAMLYTKIGSVAPKASDTASLDETVFFQRVIARRAHRWVIGHHPAKRVEWFRPRVVDLSAFNVEESEWRRFHEAQAEPERQHLRRHGQHERTVNSRDSARDTT